MPSWSIEIDQMNRVRAWYAIFQIARMAANAGSLDEIRNALIDALALVDEALKCTP